MTLLKARTQERGKAARVWDSLWSLLVLGGLLGLLSGCSTPPERGKAALVQPSTDVLPKAEPRSRSGNPASYVVKGRRYFTKQDSKGHVERGLASWYGPGFHGRKTSSGERYDMYAMTAAHKTLPLPTYAKVTNLENGRSAVVRINDRGPFHGPRVIDLSKAAASRLGVLGTGTAEVEVRALESATPQPIAPSPFLVAEKKAEPQSFLDGFDSPGAAPPGREAPAAPKGPEPSQAIADAASSRSVPRIDPAQAKPSRELVIAHAGTPKAKAAAPARRSPPASVKGKAEVELAAAAAKAEKGKAEAIASKPGQGKGLAASDTKAANKAGARGIKTGGMYVQVGAFGSRSNAEQLRKRLSKELARLQVQVRSIGGDDAQLYKVQVGPLASRAKASDVSQQLAALGVKKSHVIVE